MSRRKGKGTCLLLKDLALNLVLKLLQLMQLGELVLLLEEHLWSEGRRRGKGRSGGVQALKGYQIRHGHEIEGLLVEEGIVGSGETWEGIGYTMSCERYSGHDVWLVSVLWAILVGGVWEEKGKKVLLLVILGG